MAIEIKASDIRSNTIVTPGWYIVDVVSLTRKPAKTDGSTNFNYRLKIVSDLKGGTQFDEARVKDVLINEKGIFGSGIAFFGAIDPEVKKAFDAIKKDKSINEVPKIDEDAPIGKRIKAAIKTTTFDGRESNEAHDFLPI